jgi:type II secretory pathway component PulC
MVAMPQAVNQSIAVLVLIALFLITVQAPMGVIKDYKIAHHSATDSHPQAVIDSHIDDLIQALPTQHLLGHAEQEVADYIPVTSMQVSLVGIMQAATPERSRVIISEGGQSGKLYRLNERLPSGLLIHAITSEGVILDNAGHLEKLPLKRNELLFRDPPRALLK